MENLPTPLSRVELYLAKACGMDVTVPEQPLSRLEQFLAILAGDTSITMPAPIGLTEQWLAYVLGVTPDPLLAVEGACLIGAQKVDVRYFAVAASMPGATLPEAPQNRAEMYWAHIAGNPPTPGILKYVTGKYFYLTDVVSGIEELQYVKGDTYQQTYSGANFYNVNDVASASSSGVSVDDEGWITLAMNNTGSSTQYVNYFSNKLAVQTSTDYLIVVEIKDFTPGNNGYISVAGTANTEQFKADSNLNIGFSTMQKGVSTYIRKSVADFTGVTYGLRTTLVVSANTNRSVTFRISVIADTSITPETFVYQPYTGGIPAPNPGYPQDIQVVTGTQNVWVHGKNILHGMSTTTATNYGVTHTWDNNTVTLSGTASGGYSNVTQNNFSTIPAGTYTFSTPTPSGVFNTNLRVRCDGTNYNYKIPKNGTSVTFTIPKEASTFLIYIDGLTAGTRVSGVYSYMLERNSTVTTYEPYQGANYIIDLGATELCKIGDYQDKIFNNDPNEDWYNPDLEDNAWYVHKETGKIDLTNTFGWWASGTHTIKNSLTNLGISNIHTVGITQITEALCNYFTAYRSDRLYQGANKVGFGISDGFYFSNNDWSLGDFNTFKSNNQILVHYALATPTDTKITDSTLVGQLDALNSALLPKPIANITVSATGTNLTPYLTIAYYGSDE